VPVFTTSSMAPTGISSGTLIANSLSSARTWTISSLAARRAAALDVVVTQRDDDHGQRGEQEAGQTGECSEDRERVDAIAGFR
jgi:hypothetical protein